MNKPVFRNPDKLQVLPYREWIRDNLPTGKAGMVVEDLDLVIRVYGHGYGTDEEGKFMLCELKHGLNTQMNHAQIKTFKLVDSILAAGDPNGTRYVGHFLVNYSAEDWDNAVFAVNNLHLSSDLFKKFLMFDPVVLADIAQRGWSPLLATDGRQMQRITPGNRP